MKRLMMCLVVAGAMACAANLAAAKASAPPATGDKPAASAGAFPDAAGAAIAKAFPNATVESVSEYGKDLNQYLVTLAEGAKSFTVRVSGGGVIILVTTPVTAADLPKPVADAATAAAKGAVSVINRATRLERRANEKLNILGKPEVTYDIIVVIRDGGSISMTVAEDGKVTRDMRMR